MLVDGGSKCVEVFAPIVPSGGFAQKDEWFFVTSKIIFEQFAQNRNEYRSHRLKKMLTKYFKNVSKMFDNVNKM